LGRHVQAGFAPQQNLAPALAGHTDAHQKPVYFPVQEFAKIFLTGIGLFLLGRSYEFGCSYWQHGLEGSLRHLLVNSFLADFVFLFSSGMIFFIPFALLYQWRTSWANGFLKTAFYLLVLMQLLLSQYFLTSLVPLGADVWGYSMDEVKLAVGAAGVLNFWSIGLLLGLMALLVWAFQKIPKG